MKKYLLISIGTRGDIEPFIALASLLKKEGHHVKVACPEQYLYLLKDLELESFGLDKRFVQLIEGEQGKLIMGGKIGFFQKIKLYISLYKNSIPIQKELMKQQYELIADFKPDKLFFSAKALYGFVHHLESPSNSILLSPIPYMIHPKSERPNIGFKKSFGSVINKWTYALANYGIAKSTYSLTKKLHSHKLKSVKKALKEVPLIYSISPLLFKRDPNWPKRVSILGYLERDKMLNYEPSTALKEFLSKHDKILFLTFGSMENPEPNRNSKLLVKVLKELQIPTIINCANGGLEEVESNRDLTCFINGIPYDWILPKMHAVIHHGGAGTTHLCLKYACSSMIIPHIIDQYLWNDVLSSQKLGPKGIPIKSLSHIPLKALVKDLWTNEVYKSNAKNMSLKMKEENVEEQFLDFLKGL